MHEQEMSQEEIEAMLRQWFYVGQPILYPVAGVVVGFGRKYLQRGGRDHNQAGTYVDHLKVCVAKKTGGEQTFEALSFAEGQDLRLAIRLSYVQIRIGDLPDTPFWVGDIVEYETPIREGCGQTSLVVKSIDYNANGGTRGGELYELYYIIDGKPWGLQHQDGLKRVERGNVWKLEHGEPLVFEGEDEAKRLEEEAKFYQSLGMSQKIPCEGYEHGM